MLPVADQHFDTGKPIGYNEKPDEAPGRPFDEEADP
jgi:hypothetical protein